MTTKDRYTYSVLRYVHDVVTGEFVNVGLVMLTHDHNVLAKTRKTIGRMRHVFPDLERTSFVESMKRIDRSVSRRAEALSKSGFLEPDKELTGFCNEVIKQDDSSLQWSQVGGGVTDNAEKTFDALFDRFVARYDTTSPTRKSDEDIWRPVRESLKNRGVNVEFERKQFRGTTDQIEFDRAWKNGNWHVYEPVSMDLADADGIKDKARRWRGHLAAVEDGITEEIELYFILGRPEKRALMDAYVNAVEILKAAPLNPKVFDDSDLQTLVDGIEDEYREHIKSQPGFTRAPNAN